MENFIKDYFKENELTLENVIKLCKENDALRYKIFHDVEHKFHRSDVIQECNDRRLQVNEEDVAYLTMLYEDYLSEDDGWRVAINCAFDHLEEETDDV